MSSQNNNNGFKVWSHHDMDTINEIRANRTISDLGQRIVSAFLCFGCLIGCYYTAGPVDKTTPFIFQILRTLFGENTCIGFLIFACIFGLICAASGVHIDPYQNNRNNDPNHQH